MVEAVFPRHLGRLFLMGFDGTDLAESPWLRRALAEDRLAGVLLFDRDFAGGARKNIKSPAQLRRLTAQLRQEAPTVPLIAVDQEGGRVRRLKEKDGFAPSMSAARLGCQKTVTLTRRQARIMAEDLAGCGINFNLAPVVDLNTNPDNPIIGRLNRSFGSDVHNVTRHAAAFIEAHHDYNIACSLKHFPGHGSSRHDSHLGFTDITATWSPKELEPFERLIRSGHADTIMTAHVMLRHLDPHLPATLSPAILSELLRSRLGFDGPIISDDLQMRAIADGWSYRQAVQRSILAGVDLIIVGNNLANRPNALEQGVDAVMALLEEGRIDKARLHASLDRIMTLKGKISGEIPWQTTKKGVES